MKGHCREHSTPAIGACTLLLQDGKPNALREIRDRLRKEPVIRLSPSVRVTGDFIGSPYEVRVVRIERCPQRDAADYEFLAGPDPLGDMLSSDTLSTNDIIKIKNSLNGKTELPPTT